MKFGTLIRIDNPTQCGEKFAYLHEKGFSSCQIVYKPKKYVLSHAHIIKEVADNVGIEISAMFCGYYDNYTVWDLYEGFRTSGLNIPEYAASRIMYVKSAAAFACEMGVSDIVIHAGFVPNNPFAPEYISLVEAVREIAKQCLDSSQNILLETGGESPISLLRLIEDVGTGNVYINFDPANILMYGYGNPCDALKVFGKYVRNVHGKDGILPTCTKKLGLETSVGQGAVDFKGVFRLLKSFGYDRFITIEREITGDEQLRDILAAKNTLEKLWSEA